MTHKHLLRFAAMIMTLLPAIASAHPGHGEPGSFAAGALHPLTGIDHVAGFIVVGWLAARLGGRFLAPMAAAFLGLLVAAWTSDSDGWRYATGFILSGAGLVAAGMTATRLLMLLTTAGATRSPTWVAGGSPTHRPCAKR
jgi:urease accessory protein